MHNDEFLNFHTSKKWERDRFKYSIQSFWRFKEHVQNFKKHAKKFEEILENKFKTSSIWNQSFTSLINITQVASNPKSSQTQVQLNY